MNTNEWITSEKGWKTIGRPGWFGSKKDEKLEEYDKQYGKNNWRIRHIFGPYLLDFNKAVGLYELSYEFDFMNPDRRFIWNDLMKQAIDVWTELDTDVESGLDYSIQKAPAPHYEDISIRRIMLKYGLEFSGDKLIRIRADSEDTIGKVLSSIHIPFAYPKFIESPPADMPFRWWNRFHGSLEDFWHLNKILQVRK